ncbi:MAG: hypothetical protein PHE55_13010 [Methylococcaceae bacterium]|nr:hypothetical protein [Methylococcaceae bacterium]
MDKKPLILGCSFLFVAVMHPALAEEPVACEESGQTRIWTSPLHPRIGAPLKIMAVSTDSAIQKLMAIDGQGHEIPLEVSARGGPPWSLSASLTAFEPDGYRLEAWREGIRVACREVQAGGVNRAHELDSGWNLAAEAFYSAWIEQLFDAPIEGNLSFPSLEPVLRDPERNFLYNHFGQGEDRSVPATPDCADLPYTLRAYFAWKLALPIAFRTCSRGSAQSPPRCGPASLKTEFVRGMTSPPVYRNVSGELANAVHSGSARTALDDEATDLYPLPLSRDVLWPGTVYADPYGHVLVLAKWIAQTATRPGLLLAVDAQPDNSVARKRFWEGNFLFADIASAGPGFKAFRPLARTGLSKLHELSNEELTDNPGFAPFSLEQEDLAPDDFYARLGKLINPLGLDPQQAYETTLDALVEQLETRANSVNNGEIYFRKNPGVLIAMPEGASIFETIGPWEDYSTPSRDMRLIIAMNVLDGLPDKIVRHPELFVLNGASPLDVKAQIEQYHASRIQERRIRYLRSDGSPWEITVAEAMARKPAFEMAYNPNDCAEFRWGAKPGTEEYSPCRRHAPSTQKARMELYRIWFHQARRPTR